MADSTPVMSGIFHSPDYRYGLHMFRDNAI
jgi:hypothetical protein